MKYVLLSAVIVVGLNPLQLSWAGPSACEDVECRRVQMCEEDKTITQKLLTTRKQQCDTSGGAACQAYERSLNNPDTKRLIEKPCTALVAEGYGKH